MKSPFRLICLLTALASLTLQAENLVVNGDFETGEGNAFYQTPPWYNGGTGFNQGASARSNDGLVIRDAYSATVNDRHSPADHKPGPVAHIQKTKHIIQDGDSFSLAYEWTPADDYWQRTSDTIRFVLFATENDKMGGPVVWSSELTSDFFKGKPGTPMFVSATTDVVNAEAVGKALFVRFFGVDTVDGLNGSTHWARVDSIEVTAISGQQAP
jgi:hypothetical protein